MTAAELDRIRHILCEVMYACFRYPVMLDPYHKRLEISLAIPIVNANTKDITKLILSKLHTMKIKTYFYIYFTKLPEIDEASVLNFGLYKQYTKDLDKLETLLKMRGVL